MLNFAIVAVGGLVLIAAVIVTYYAVSYLVLSLVSRIFPLTGRRPRRRT